MSTLTCKSCTHFYQHFVLTETQGVATYCGHCVFPRHKRTRPDQEACPHYQKQDKEKKHPCRQETVNFLTTKVLERILALELPPEIEEEKTGHSSTE